MRRWKVILLVVTGTEAGCTDGGASGGSFRTDIVDGVTALV